MTFPVIDPTQGVQLTDDGRDIQLTWPTDESWLTYVLRVTLWQFKGAWKFDLRRGVDYLNEVHGQVPEIAKLQSIFRRAVSRYTAVTRLLVTEPEEGALTVTFKGPNIVEAEQVNLLAPPAIESVLPERAEIVGGSTISIRMTEELNPHALPEPEDFDLINTSATVTAVSINGTHVQLTLSTTVLGEIRVLYKPGTVPMQAISRTQVETFAINATYDEAAYGFLYTDDFGFLLTDPSGFLEVSP